MTRQQAAQAYVRIVDPGNVITDAISRDGTDKAPYSQYRADALAYVKATRVADRQLRALLWPQAVEPYVKSWLLTLGPAEIRCYQAAADGGSYAAISDMTYSNPDCQAAQASTIPDTIRSLLGLPSR